MEYFENKTRFMEKVKKSIADFDEVLISKAWDFASQAHQGQGRDTGEAYFNHPIGVALTLLDIRCDTATIAAALLHDVVEDTEVTVEEVKRAFGIEIGSLVDGLSKLANLDNAPEEAWHKERRRRSNLRKLFLSISKDPRVAIIKIADRLDNISSLGALDEQRRKRIAKESLDVFALLAEALGLGILQRRIQELAFKHLFTQIYQMIEKRINEKKQVFESTQADAITRTEDALEEAKITGMVYGRQKEIYGIYSKMKAMDLEFDEVYDLIGIRIIVDSEEDCYKVAHVIDRLGVVIKYDDYIIKPRGRLRYQSLHKVIRYVPGGQLVEFQIRSQAMHEHAEYGPAAHWVYKLGKGETLDPSTLNQISNLRDSLKDLGKLLEDPDGFLMQSESIEEEIGVELTTSEITVFTPEKDIISLPSPSTPIDYAYRIHTMLGHECVGAMVDGKRVPLDFELQDGNEVKILRKKGSRPKPYWIIEGKVRSASGKQKVRAYFRKQERPKLVGFGREISDKLMNRISGFDVTQDELIQYFSNLNFWAENPTEEFFLAIADGRIPAERFERIAGKIYFEKQLLSLGCDKGFATDICHWLTVNKGISIADEDELCLAIIRKEISPELLNSAILSIKDRIDGSDFLIPIESSNIESELKSGLLAKTAKCCFPIPGDKIKGYVTVNSGITIHHINCPDFHSIKSKERILNNIDWTSLDLDNTSRFSSELIIWLYGADTETYKSIQDLIVRKRHEVIRQLTLLGTTKNGYTQLRMIVDVKNLSSLNNLKSDLRKLANVFNVKRSIED
jgi:GTP diphosphokinase / guanosine-3',5'-bis(diphosphate) 3'-diphosphatase